MPVLIGVLAASALRGRLAPDAVPTEPVAGVLRGGAMAGIALDGFPALVPGADEGGSEEAGETVAWQADWSPALRRYADIFALQPVRIGGRDVLGIGAGAGGDRSDPDLAAAIADWLLNLPFDRDAAALRRRLPSVAGWVASRMRARRDTAALPAIGPAGQDRLQVTAWSEPYADFFSVESITFRHRRHRGDWSDDVVRAVFVSNDAAVVLPWDPMRDTVLLIDQFRAGPAARGDMQPWFYETVAGRVDPGEGPAQAALREAVEEAGIAINRLIPGPHNYASPGILTEFLYFYVGIADLPDDAAGPGGLDSEDEDIFSHIIPRAELTRMALAGEIRNGPLLSLAMWLELSAGRIRAELG